MATWITASICLLLCVATMWTSPGGAAEGGEDSPPPGGTVEDDEDRHHHLHNHTPRSGLGPAWRPASRLSTRRPGPRWSRRKVLHLAGLFPLSVGNVGRGVLPAVELAMRHVNNHSSILPGYKLEMAWNDTQVRQYYLSLLFFSGAMHCNNFFIAP